MAKRTRALCETEQIFVKLFETMASDVSSGSSKDEIDLNEGMAEDYFDDE